MMISVVGAGRVGTAMAVLLERAGHRIVAVAGGARTRERASAFVPDAPFLDPVDAARAAEFVIVGVPDDDITGVVEAVADDGGWRPGQWVTHLSGAAGLGVLTPARAAGARPLALHPLQTFPDVEGALERLPGCAMAVTAEDTDGYDVGGRIAEDLGARPFRLDDAMRPLYHSAAVFASNYLIVAAGIAEDLFRRAGVPDPIAAMLPLQRASLDNVERLGPADALTGPAVRGDATTIERNLDALLATRPDVVPAYVVLCRAALELASASGRLPPERRSAVEEVLARWS